MPFDDCIKWIEQHIECEVYLLHQEQVPNGFVEFRNGGHIIYLLADLENTDPQVLLEILAHEAGHVLYNRKKMNMGISYEDLVAGTQAKLSAFHELWRQKIITDEEYDRLYHAIEEEWESNQHRDWIIQELRAVF